MDTVPCIGVYCPTYPGGTLEEDQATFEDLAEKELGELGFNLAMCQSSQESSTTGTKPPTAMPSPELSLIRMLLRDTLVRGWLEGVQEVGGVGGAAAGGDADTHTSVGMGTSDDGFFGTGSAELFTSTAVYALLKLALIMSWDVIA